MVPMPKAGKAGVLSPISCIRPEGRCSGARPFYSKESQGSARDLCFLFCMNALGWMLSVPDYHSSQVGSKG